jgi:hypothetical protein
MGEARRNRPVGQAAIEPPGSTGNRPSGSREHGGSFLRQAGQAQAGDMEFDDLRSI